MADLAVVTIPMADLRSDSSELKAEIGQAIERVLRSGQFILGPEVDAFEREVADYLGVGHAVGVGSGTEALLIGLRALGIGPGDEVITTAFSFFATAEAIIHAGATPVFVDIRPDSFTIDPDAIEAAVTQKTRAIVPVSLFGNPAAMGRISAIATRHGLPVLEDGAQSFGAHYEGDDDGDDPDPELLGRKVGALATATAFSFYPTKNLGAFGDAGLLTTDDEEIARLARLLRNHGEVPGRRYHHAAVGYTSRLDALQAAVLRVKLPHIDRWNSERRRLAKIYEAGLAASGWIQTPKVTAGHVFHQYSICLPPTDRDPLSEHLARNGISSRVHYPTSLSAFVGPNGGDETAYPRSFTTSRRILSLPIYPGLRGEEQERIVEMLLAFGESR